MTESLANMEAVRPKGPKIFVGLLGLVAAGGVAWFFLGRAPGPIGEPEDPSKLLLVGTDDPAAPLLEQMGFEVEQLAMTDAASQGRSAGSPAEDDVDAALHYADTQGYGYVAFAGASDIDFGSREVSPQSAAVSKHHRYAVFSVGDLANPVTTVTVDPSPRLYDVPAHAELVRALFEQEKLAATLVGENNLSMEAQPLFERIQPAVELKGAFGLVEQKAVSAEKRLREYVIDAEEADPKPAMLTKDVERGHGYALANGSALVLLDAPILQDPTTNKVRLEWTADTRAWSVDIASGERTRCEAGDRIRPGDVEVQANGAALLTRWGDDELMVFTVDPEAPGCGLKTEGTVGLGDSGWGQANAAGRVVRAAIDGDESVAELHTPDGAHPETWSLSGCTLVSRPIWLSPTHIATACEYRPPAPVFDDYGDTDDEPEAQAEPTEPEPEPIPEQRWIYLVDTTDGTTLAYPLPEEHGYNPKLTLRPTKDGVAILAERGINLVSYTFSSDAAGLFASPPVDPELAKPAFVEGEGIVTALQTTAATAKVLEFDESVGDFVVAPDGSGLLFGADRSGEFDRNLAFYGFASGKTRRIAINEWARHDDPTFGPDSRSVVFNSTYSTPGYGRATVAQSVSLPGS
jgi:hypothetical protein